MSGRICPLLGSHIWHHLTRDGTVQRVHRSTNLWQALTKWLVGYLVMILLEMKTRIGRTECAQATVSLSLIVNVLHLLMLPSWILRCQGSRHSWHLGLRHSRVHPCFIMLCCEGRICHGVWSVTCGECVSLTQVWLPLYVRLSIGYVPLCCMIWNHLWETRSHVVHSAALHILHIGVLGNRSFLRTCNRRQGWNRCMPPSHLKHRL